MISVILILVSIGAVAASRFTAEARRVQVKAMLEGLKGAQEEFVAKRQQGKININDAPGSSPIDWTLVDSGNGVDYSSSERFVYGCEQVQTAEEMMLAAVNSGPRASLGKIFGDAIGGNGVNEIYDRWGTQIEYRPSNDGTGTGPETGIANNLLPITSKALFVSAGPDKTFGTEDDVHTEDN